MQRMTLADGIRQFLAQSSDPTAPVDQLHRAFIAWCGIRVPTSAFIKAFNSIHAKDAI